MPQKRKQKEKKTVVGILSVTRRGVGYVTVEGYVQDIEIDPEHLNVALHGDTVEVALLAHKRAERQQGKIIKVASRARERFVGTLEKERGRYFLAPDSKKVHIKFSIPARDAEQYAIKNNDKALVKLTSWLDPKEHPVGSIIRILGQRGNHGVEMESIVLEHGFDTRFPARVAEEARSIQKRSATTDEDIAKRRDFRGVPTFTIDPEDAKDFDDALSVRELKGGKWEVGIHIADVSHYVISGGAIDKEALERGTSIYLVDRTIPMLPEVLSNDLCSLNPDEDKRAYSAVFVLDKDARVHEQWFGETLIRSDKRFTYREAQGVLDTGNGPHHKEMRILNALATRLRAAREREGAISFEQDEVQFELDGRGKPIRIYRKPRLAANLLIEDFMLLANRKVAEHFDRLCKRSGLNEAVFVYRIHDVPDIDKIEELAIFLRAIGYDFKTKKGEVSGKEINRLFREIEGKPEEDLIKVATIRSMAKAVYSTKNIGHFGLAFRYYTHFTSPIRRYPDVMVHRIMKSHLPAPRAARQAGLDGKRLTKRELVEYERLAIQSSQREVEAVAAERDSIKLKQVEYMAEHVGETFDGIITGVTERGLYIEENETRAEGMIKIRNLSDDYYNFEEKRYRLVGQKTKKVYALGDRVRVKLIDANTDDKTLEWLEASPVA